MASPLRPGTYASDAFSSRDIDILKERIHITVDQDFRNAFYKIEYYIRSDSAGSQVPLLFYAKDYKGAFRVWVDDKAVTLLDIPPSYTAGDSVVEKFSNAFSDGANSEKPAVTIHWDKNRSALYSLDDLKYFEVAISKGEHQIRVEYVAAVWTDVSGWIKEYSFRYALSPAQHWRSFSSLEITVDGTAFNRSLESNVGNPSRGSTNAIATWNFSKLPGDYFEIVYKPQVNAFVALLIAVAPFGLAIIFGLLLMLLHFFSIKKFRGQNPETKYSWIMIAGSLLIPLAILIFYIGAYDIIDDLIGEDAGRYHGYTFLAIALYPLILPVYFFVMWLVDKQIKLRIAKSA
ncbi:MAG TPA: hypothetical protein PKM63_02045 [Panacibacter sp.]|nr:hypothetical protein [Panacibacter sp.]HNP43038.1 hypothetical protein [Panacibacter sp.]